MREILQFLFFLLITSYSLSEIATDPTTIYNHLRLGQEQINANTSSFCYHNGHSQTKNAFLSNQFFGFTKPYHALIYPFCITTHELGNRLGNYFQEVACAEASGIHFVAVHPQWEYPNALTSNSSHLQQLQNNVSLSAKIFFEGFPTILLHPTPLDMAHASHKIQHECKCTRYCWGHANAPWVNRTQNLRKYIQQVVTHYQQHIDLTASTTIDPTVDVTNAKDTDHLPLIPDVAMQYRCGDNIAFNYMYGILPFTVVDHRIPSTAKYIYVLSDHPSRAVYSPYTSRCKLILEKLLEYLQERFPHAIIVIKRGGDLFLDFVRFAKAKVTICSASTFCFWPALSNDGDVFYPVTSLIAGVDELRLAPNFGPHFHWFDTPPIISNFKGLRPWTQIIDVLQGKAQMPK
jgi:hypothetical protein